MQTLQIRVFKQTQGQITTHSPACPANLTFKENVALLFRRTACLVIATTFQLLNAVLGRLVEASSAISNLDYISNFHQFPTTLRHL